MASRLIVFFLTAALGAADDRQSRQRFRSGPETDAGRLASVGISSEGQAYKGGPNSGVFLQITAGDAEDLQVPGQKYMFGVVKAAQARGDLQVLTERGRRALRIHLGADSRRGIGDARFGDGARWLSFLPTDAGPRAA